MQVSKLVSYFIGKKKSLVEEIRDVLYCCLYVATVYTGMSVLYVATSDYPIEKVNRGNSPETGTLLATALRRPPFSVCRKGIEDVCSLHASYDGDCYRLFSIIVHCRAQLQK